VGAESRSCLPRTQVCVVTVQCVCGGRRVPNGASRAGSPDLGRLCPGGPLAQGSGALKPLSIHFERKQLKKISDDCGVGLQVKD